MEVLALALCLGCFLRLQSTAAQTLPGSCIDAGYTTCCEGSPSNCPGQPPSCFCDSSCHEFSDCCQDIDQLCPALPPPPKPLLLPPTRITFHSATVQWISTNSSTDRSYAYLVNYHTGDSETNTTAVNVTEHLESGQVYSSLLGGLVPGTTYTYSVIAVNTPRRSARSEEAVFTTFEHPVVRHVSTEVLSTTSVRVTWSALDLPSGVRVTHYCVHYSGSTVPPQEVMQLFPAGVTCGEVGGLIPHTTYLFHVVGTIMDIDGSVSQESSPDNGSIIFVPDTALFQLRGGPLAACDDWNAERERGLSTFFQFVTARAISSRCGCVYQNSLITGGSLLCEAGTPVYATYRANLTSTENCTAGTLLRCVEDWVAQGAAAQGPSGSLITLNNNCPVSIRLRSAPLCRQPGPSNTSAPRTETCVSIPILAATLVAELLFIAAVVMVVTLAALLVISNKGKRSISSGQTLEPSTQHEAMPNVYEHGQPEPPRQQMYQTGSVEPPRQQMYQTGSVEPPRQQMYQTGSVEPPRQQMYLTGSVEPPRQQMYLTGSVEPPRQQMYLTGSVEPPRQQMYQTGSVEPPRQQMYQTGSVEPPRQQMYLTGSVEPPRQQMYQTGSVEPPRQQMYQTGSVEPPRQQMYQTGSVEPPRQQMYQTGSVEPPRRPTYEDGQTHTNGIDNPPAEQTV